MIDLERKKIQRFKVLEEVYKQTNGDEMAIVNLTNVCNTIGVPPNEHNPLVEYLVGEHLIEHRTLGGGICITHEGVKEIEEAQTNPNLPTEHFPAFNVVYVENMHNSQIQQGNINSSQSMTVSNVTEVRSLFERLLVDISNENCSEDKKDALIANIEILKSQVDLDGEQRNTSLIRKSWSYLGKSSSLLSVGTFIASNSDKIVAFFGL